MPQLQNWCSFVYNLHMQEGFHYLQLHKAFVALQISAPCEMGTGQSKEEQLYQAAALGNHSAVKSYCHDGASLEWTDKEGRTPLIVACTRAELFGMVITLLDSGANLNAYRPGAFGGSPLHHAAKRGLDKTVALLLTKGANPLLVNDDGQTPLDMARLRGHLTIVRLIEDHIGLFCGTVREISGPAFLEALAPQWVTKKVWAVVVPAGYSNRRRAPRYELVIYQSSKVPRPKVVISLAKADVDEPKLDLPDPVLTITERLTKSRFKFLSENEGDKEQLEALYKACKGIPEVDEGGPTEAVAQGMSVVGGLHFDPHLMGQDGVMISEDVALAVAINESLKSAPSGAPFTSLSPVYSKENEHQGWANTPEGIHNGWALPDLKRLAEKRDYGGWTDEGKNSNYGGWADQGKLTSDCSYESSGAGPSTAHDYSNMHLNVSGEGLTTAGSVPLPQRDLASGVSGLQASYTINGIPSAPPLSSEYVPSGADDSLPIHYPSIDTSPIDLNCSLPDSSNLLSVTKEKVDDKADNNLCVICWDSPAEAVCIPCGHLAGCMECLSEVKGKQWGCPVCRTSINQVIKVYTV